MTPRRPDAEPQPAPAAVDDRGPEGGPQSVTRRAPFADNPEVGARGQRTQQRILDAALRVFGEVGYHQCGVARITRLAGCSRASFYQYFSSKEDVFRQLAGQVIRQLSASIEALDPVTPDTDGWKSVRAWVARHGDIYERYQPVYQAFQAAAESDEMVAAGSVRIGERNIAMIRSKLVASTLPARQQDRIIQLLLECLTRTQDTAALLRTVLPDDYPRERVDDALADVVHRTLFGLRADLNVHPPADPPPRALRFGPVMEHVFRQDGEAAQLTPTGKRTLQALLQAGRDVFVARGYHSTRVDDIVAAAGVSHGAFYRYFQSKDDLAHVLAGRAMRNVSTAFTEIAEAVATDGLPERAVLRKWLRHYNTTHATETTMIRVWVDAALSDPALETESAAVFDWGRRRMVRVLRPRDFGDVETEAVAMMSLLSSFGTRPRSAATIESVADIIDRGFLGR